MSFNFMHSTEALLSHPGVPWDLAPKPVIGAYAAVDKANLALVAAIDAVADGEVELPAAESQYDLEAKAAVRAGETLPSKAKLELAQYKSKVAKEDEATARQGVANALGNLASLIEGGPDGDPAVRNEWRTAATKRADKLRADIRSAADTIAPAVAELNAILGTDRFIDQWRVLPYVPQPIEGNPVGALHAAANTRGHLDNQGNIT